MLKRMKSSELRQVLFEKFSGNLNIVREHPALKFDGDFVSATLCPLCLEALEAENLDFDSTHPKSATLEDVPPRTLGGKPRMLSCRTCNTRSGHALDFHLKRRLERTDFMARTPGAEETGDIRLLDDCVRAKIVATPEGYSALLYDKGFDPSQKKSLRVNLRNPPVTLTGPTLEVPFATVVRHDNPNIRLAPLATSNAHELALLRIAHLLAFNMYGHGWLLNDSLSRVREQLCSPNKTLIEGAFILPGAFWDEHLGMNLIVAPNDLVSFLAVFDLTTKTSQHRFGVLLPGPTKPGLSAYTSLQTRLEKGSQAFDVTCVPLGDASCVPDPSRAFESLALWQFHVTKRGVAHP